MKAAILRTADHRGRSLYVSRVGHDGDFSLTYRKADARTFTPETAVTARARLRTRMTFTVCPSAEFATDVHVAKYIARAEANA